MATLINDSETLKSNLAAIDANFNWLSIKSYVEDAERDIIADSIGQEAVDYFLGNIGALNGVRANVLQLLQRAEAYLAAHLWSKTALFRLTDKALYVAKSSDGAIISDKKLVKLQQHFEDTGFNYLDKAIGLMEANLDQLVAYRDSGTRQTLIQGFIKTATEFNFQRSIDNSRLTFISIHAIMLDAQDEYLPRYMGSAYYAAYKERYLDDELSINEKKLLPLIKKAVAFLTIAGACGQLPVKVGNKGLLINKYNSTGDYEQADPADAARADMLKDDSQEMAERKLRELQNYLVSNASLFPGYTPPDTGSISPNCQDSGFFIM